MRHNQDGPGAPGRRRFLLAGLSSLALAGCAQSRLATAIAGKPFYADGMSFLPASQDLVDLSGLDVFICDVSLGKQDVDANGNPFYHRTFELCDQSITDAARRVREDFPTLRVALDGDDIGVPGTQAAVFQFQGCEPLGGDLSRIAYFRDKSLRILQLTHNESNAFATSYVDERKGTGLTQLGQEAVREMNRVKLVPDVSHASEATALETVKASTQPVILSHTSCRALLPHPRAATDRMIRAVADSGGVVGIFMMSFWLTEATVPTTEHFVAQIRHAVKVAGIDAVAIANDYPMDGLRGSEGLMFDNAKDMDAYRSWWESNRARGIPGFGDMPVHAVIPELNSIHRMALIHKALLDAGFRSGDAEKIVGGNWRRFLKQNIR